MDKNLHGEEKGAWLYKSLRQERVGWLQKMRRGELLGSRHSPQCSGEPEGISQVRSYRTC